MHLSYGIALLLLGMTGCVSVSEQTPPRQAANTVVIPAPAPAPTVVAPAPVMVRP